jgi:hypothetical protein
MKKVFLSLAVIGTLTVTSCKHEVKQDEATEVVADSTLVDSTLVDTVSVDTTQVK